MKKHELSRVDFEVIEAALTLLESTSANSQLIMKAWPLRDLFRKAHTGWLEVEDDE